MLTVPNLKYVGESPVSNRNLKGIDIDIDIILSNESNGIVSWCLTNRIYSLTKECRDLLSSDSSSITVSTTENSGRETELLPTEEGNKGVPKRRQIQTKD